MAHIFRNLLDRLNDPSLKDLSIIEWASPIPSFGDLEKSKLATVGLNPSNREFVDRNGKELSGVHRRFSTLSSLGLKSWNEINNEQFEKCLAQCSNYFEGNPYDAWFKKLDFLISGAKYSFYKKGLPACHLDLVPYATSEKWSSLNKGKQERLLKLMGDTLGLLIRESEIDILILNGHTVVKNFEVLSKKVLSKEKMTGWTLPRKSGGGVTGFGYKGTISTLGGIPLPGKILILGFNHNIQSSFGVTKMVQKEVKNWITLEIEKFRNDKTK